MPSAPDAPTSFTLQPPLVPVPAAVQLAQANRALWAAPLSLMTAFMQTAAPTHRYLLARRIARNFGTLSRQDCFDCSCRASFGRLAHRWHARSEQLSPQRDEQPRAWLPFLPLLF